MSSVPAWPCAAVAAAPLAPRTTLRVGGAAEWLLEPATPEELAAAWRMARELGLRPRVLGGGANVVVEGGVLPGVVIATDRLKRVFRPGSDQPRAAAELLDAGTELPLEPPDRTSDPRLVAWAGVTLPRLVNTAQQLGWTGLEGLVGVPGQLGGGVAMNAGGRWGELWDVVEAVRVVGPDGELRDLPRAECCPRYRDGNLGPDVVVVGAVLRLAPDDPAAVRARTRDHLREKNAVQPVSEWSAGCVFKNPDPELADGRSAGKLVDDCGGKGRARGDAVVSERHGNFIVNRGRATAADVLTLIEDLRDLVLERAGVRLETEVKLWLRDGA